MVFSLGKGTGGWLEAGGGWGAMGGSERELIGFFLLQEGGCHNFRIF